MGGPAITHAVEEGLGTSTSQAFKNWISTSGRTFLKELGGAGEFLASHLDQFEAYAAGTRSRTRQVVEQVHTDPQKLQTLQNSLITKLQQSGTPINKAIVSQPFVYHPDLAVPNHPLRRQAIVEIRNKSGFTQGQAEDTINKLLTDQNTRDAAMNMLDPVFPLQTGLLPTKERYIKWGDAASKKVAENLYFGPQDSNLAAIVHTIKNQKGRVSASNVADMLDIYLHNTMPGAYRVEGLKHQAAYRPANEAEKIINKLSSYIFTSRIAIPHATQWVNTILNSGVKSSLEGVLELISNKTAAKDFVLQSGALDEELRRELEVGIRGGESWFKKLVHQPGFNWIRKQELIFSAVTGKHEALDAAQHLIKNPASKDAATVLGKLGIDANDVIRSGGLTPDMERTAAYFAANRDMYFRGSQNVPFKWNGTPMSRMLNMYKPFAFNMTRMIKDTLYKDLERGGVNTKNLKTIVSTMTPQATWNITKTLAVLGTLFPAVGELIVLAENQALGRQDQPLETDTPFPQDWKNNHELLDQYINAMAHVSAFGIVYSMFRSAKRRMIGNFFLGPVVSSSFDFLGDILKGTIGSPTGPYGETEHDFMPAVRDVTRKVPLIGPGLTRRVLPEKKKQNFGTKPSRRY